MEATKKREIFNRLLFSLNAAYPHQPGGAPMTGVWKTCEELSCQVIALLLTYLRYSEELGSPLLLCEIANRCAW